MVKKNYEVPRTNAVGTTLRHTILVGSRGLSQAQQAAGVPDDTPKVDKNPLLPGLGFD